MQQFRPIDMLLMLMIARGIGISHARVHLRVFACVFRKGHWYCCSGFIFKHGYCVSSPTQTLYLPMKWQGLPGEKLDAMERRIFRQLCRPESMTSICSVRYCLPLRLIV